MRVLVTGGAGYVGSHAARQLVRHGHDVWVYDNLSQGHRAAVPGNRLIVGHLSDRERLEGVLATHKIDAVMHFAAFTLVGESVVDPAKYYQNNVLGSFSLIESMRAVGVKRIVFSSTAAVYGQPDKSPISEQAALAPVNPYGMTKLSIEQVLLDYAAAYGFGFAALRYFNAAGAAPEGDLGEDHLPESHLIPLVLQVALGQRPHITVFGNDYATPDGTCVRDYIHVDDLAAAHIKALEQLGPGVALRMNLGTGRGHSVQAVIEACRRVTGHAIPAVMGERRPGDPAELVADSHLAQQTLGWQPQHTDLDQIVASAWRWHSTHPRGYDDRSK
jgi:UDP-glucose-4-epimerase GalE